MAAFYVQTSVMDLLNIYLNIYQELKRTIMDLDLQITRKHPVIRYNKLIHFLLDYGSRKKTF